MTYYQQGDVILKPTQAVPSSAKVLKHKDLKRSQVTGHAHALRGRVTVYQDGSALYVKAAAPFKVVHEEHKTFEVPKGLYVVEDVQEYDHFAEEARAVAD